MKIIRYTRFLLLPLIAICGFQEIPAGTRPGNQAADESPACHSVTVLPGDHDYFSLRDPLKNSRILFNRENSSRVAFLGGSITYNPGWRDQVCQYLESRYPETGFEFINAGIPSMGSTPGAFRVSRDVLSHGRVDLLFAEAAVNDASNGRSAVEQVRAMEGIVRQAWEANPAMDIVFLYFADPGKTAAYQEDKVPDVISNHEKVAEYYGISSLNLAWEVAERIEAGQFSWKQDFRDLHPSPFGQHLYAQSIKRMLAACDNYPFNQDASVTGHKLPDQLLDRDS